MSIDDFEIIDVHYHLLRDIGIEKAAGLFPGRRDRDRIGSPEGLVPYMQRFGISKAVIVNYFPTHGVIKSALNKLPADLTQSEKAEAEEKIKQEIPAKIRRQNAWACEVGKQYPQLVPLVGIQPILGKDGMVEEAIFGKRNGAKGVKMHPGSHLYFSDDKQLWPLYEKCQELGLVILSDSGPYEEAKDGLEYSEPIHWTDVLRDFPRLTLVLAHLGSAFWDERLDLAKQFPNVYFDTSHGFSTPWSIELHGYRGIPAVDAPRIMRRIGIERIMYGSDGPMGDPMVQVEEIRALDLTDAEKRMVLAENAKRIFKI